MLQRVRSQHRRALVLIEGVYSADGDIPDLKRFIEVKDRHAAMLAVVAAVLAFRFHRGLIEVIIVMALLGIVSTYSF